MNRAPSGVSGPGGIDVEQLFLNGAGRVGRWPFAVGLIVLLALLALFERVTPPRVQALTAWLPDLALLFSACAVISKRLHDLGLAGWWTSFGVLAFLNVWPAPGGLGWFFLALLSLGALWLATTAGQPRFNRFGPPPG